MVVLLYMKPVAVALDRLRFFPFPCRCTAHPRAMSNVTVTANVVPDMTLMCVNCAF